MTNLVVAAVIAAIVGGALWYIRREKKKGKRCAACPYAGECSGCCNRK